MGFTTPWGLTPLLDLLLLGIFLLRGVLPFSSQGFITFRDLSPPSNQTASCSLYLFLGILLLLAISLLLLLLLLSLLLLLFLLAVGGSWGPTTP